MIKHGRICVTSSRHYFRMDSLHCVSNVWLDPAPGVCQWQKMLSLYAMGAIMGVWFKLLPRCRQLQCKCHRWGGGFSRALSLTIHFFGKKTQGISQFSVLGSFGYGALGWGVLCESRNVRDLNWVTGYLAVADTKLQLAKWHMHHARITESPEFSLPFLH